MPYLNGGRLPAATLCRVTRQLGEALGLPELGDCEFRLWILKNQVPPGLFHAKQRQIDLEWIALDEVEVGLNASSSIVTSARELGAEVLQHLGDGVPLAIRFLFALAADNRVAFGNMAANRWNWPLPRSAPELEGGSLDRAGHELVGSMPPPL